jgi:hypothetical protein
MELADSSDLEKYLESQFPGLTLLDKLKLVKGITGVLRSLHKNYIIHCDLVSNL